VIPSHPGVTAAVPTDGKTDRTYDPAGNMVSETDADGRTTLYGYDDAGQLVSRSNDEGETAVFAYDDVGRLTLARNADAEVAFDYDVFGRVIAESINGRTIRYEYDRAGRRTTRRTPSGAMSRFTYDDAGRLAALHTAGRTVRFAYDPGGRESVRRLYGVTSDTPVTGDPICEPHTGGRWRYRYDAFGRRIAEQRLDGAGGIVEQTQFTWDGTNLAEEVRVGTGQPTVAVVWEWLPGTDRPVTRTRRVLGHDEVEFHAVPAASDLGADARD
jgi:YD repeat-containing protein